MNLIYPWAEDNMRINRTIVAQIWGDLYNMNPRCLKYKRESPDKKTLEIVKDVFKIISDGKWAIVTCDDICILQTFADVFPIVYSFTIQKYSYMADTEKLISVIEEKSYDDGSMTNMDRVRKYPLLLWSNITANHRWGNKYMGAIANILQERVSNGGVLVSTYLYSEQFTEAYLVRLFTSINGLWGETVQNIVSQMSKVMIYKTRKKDESSCIRREL